MKNEWMVKTMGNKTINILVLSVGTRNKIIRYFKRAMANKTGERIGKVIATDMSPLAPALYEADKYYIVPKITDETYLDKIIDICKKERVKGVLSLIDPELSILARNKDRFESIGVTLIGSDFYPCELSLDKMKMYHWLRDHGYQTAKSYDEKHAFIKDLELENISFPVFVKPIRGSASIKINKVDDLKTLNVFFDNSKRWLIQEYLYGQEIGADVYVDLITGETVSIFTKKKLLMRAGETDKSVSFKDDKLFALIKRFVEEVGYRGPVDIDIFQVNGKYYISEVNPRFGGGYPHAYECGCDFMKFIIKNLKGKINDDCIGGYDEHIYMMKYSEVMIQ